MTRIRLRSASILVTVLGLTLGACSNNRIGKSNITIDSTPRGAEVYASGEKIGTTPLDIVPDKIFPPRWVKTTYRAAGVLSIDKKGCKPYTLEVDDYVLSKDILAELECERTVVHTEPAAQSTPSSTQENARAAERLRELEGLRTRGLVTEEEYQRIRRRILDTL